MRKSMILEPGGPKIDQNGAKERSENDLGNWGGNLGSPSNSILRLLRHLGDFGRHLGPSWAPRGSQNPAFWHQVVPKSIKMMSRGGSQKKV